MKRIITVLGVAALMAVMLTAMAAPAMAKKKPASPKDNPTNLQGFETAHETQLANSTLSDAGGSLRTYNRFDIECDELGGEVEIVDGQIVCNSGIIEPLPL